jgi:hypothetical protein
LIGEAPNVVMISRTSQFGLPTDNPHRHHLKEQAVPHLHTEKQQEQSLSDYAQQDLPNVTKRSPLDMQRL